MPNRSYRRGRAFEYQRKVAWESAGYTVLRTSGSHGPFDLVAIPTKPNRPIMLIQCKRVATAAQATRLGVAFRQAPPAPPSEGYWQILELGVRRPRTLGRVVVKALDNTEPTA